MRDKVMAYPEFAAVQSYNGQPVQIDSTTLFSWMRNIPQGILHSVYASGSSANGALCFDPRYGSGIIVGGIENFRNAPDDPVDFNKDCYEVISGWNPTALVIRGPFKDKQHWTNQIPYTGIPKITI